MADKFYNCLGFPGTIIKEEHMQFIIEFCGEEYGSSKVNLSSEELWCGICVSTAITLGDQREFADEHGEEVVTITGVSRREGVNIELCIAELWLSQQD